MLCESRHRQRTDIGTSAFWIRLIGSRALCGSLDIMLSCVLLSTVTPFTNRGRASGDQRYLACYVPGEPEELSSDCHADILLRPVRRKLQTPASLR